MALGIGLGLGTGCYTHQCDPVDAGYSGGELQAVGDTLVYTTSPLDSPTETWLNYPGMVQVTVTYPESIASQLAGYTMLGGPIGWVGTSNTPDDDASDFTQGVGQLAQFSEVTNRGFTVTNTSCAGYYALFEVTYRPLDAGAPASDAAPDAGE